MLFTLEAVKAQGGDALLIHFGDPHRPRLILVDGGPPGAFGRFLQPRLDRLKTRRSPRDPLVLDLILVSHVDADHLAGILDLTRALRDRRELREPEPYRVRRLWHNRVEEVMGGAAEELLPRAEEALGLGDVEGFDLPPETLDTHPGAALVASAPLGRTLRFDAQRLEIPVNRFEGELVLASDDPVPFRDGLSLRILAPREERVEALREELASSETPAAELVDEQVLPLSSLVVLAEMETKRVLLTGDAPGDVILEGVETAGLLDDGRLSLDVLKVPCHGSSRCVDETFFEKLPATHYVISADGSHGRPGLETLEALFRSVRRRMEAGELDEENPVYLHMTYGDDEMDEAYPAEELEELLEDATDEGLALELRLPPVGDLSLHIDLLEPLQD